MFRHSCCSTAAAGWSEITVVREIFVRLCRSTSNRLRIRSSAATDARGTTADIREKREQQPYQRFQGYQDVQLKRTPTPVTTGARKHVYNGSSIYISGIGRDKLGRSPSPRHPGRRLHRKHPSKHDRPHTTELTSIISPLNHGEADGAAGELPHTGSHAQPAATDQRR